MCAETEPKVYFLNSQFTEHSYSSVTGEASCLNSRWLGSLVHLFVCILLHCIGWTWSIVKVLQECIPQILWYVNFYAMMCWGLGDLALIHINVVSLVCKEDARDAFQVEWTPHIMGKCENQTYYTWQPSSKNSIQPFSHHPDSTQTLYLSLGVSTSHTLTSKLMTMESWS